MDELLKNKQEVQESFNKIITTMYNHLAKKYPQSYFGIYSDTANKFIVERPNEPISYFIKYVYSNDEYREKIIAGDDSYFVNQEYEEASNYASKIFKIKELWSSFDEVNKKLVKQTFKHMVDRSRLYIEILSNINKLKNQ